MKWIERCLHCLESSILHTEIVVVDNGSIDETLSFIKKNYPIVHIIKNEKNRGFGQANNQGIEYAYKEGATHFFLCNQDLYVKPDTFEKLVKIQNRYGLYVVSPLQMNGNFELLDRSFFRLFAKDNIKFVSDLTNSNMSDFYEAKFVPAAAWMISRECIEKIGGFDPLFFHYSEDANFMKRLEYHKKKVGVVPCAFAGHDRVFKGNLKAFNKYAPLSTLLYIHSNPFKKVWYIDKERVSVHLIFIRDIFRCLFRLEFKHCWELFLSYLSFWAKLRKISYSIRMNKHETSNWLAI